MARVQYGGWYKLHPSDVRAFVHSPVSQRVFQSLVRFSYRPFSKVLPSHSPPPSLSSLSLSSSIHPSPRFVLWETRVRNGGEGRGGACTRSSLANQPIDTAVPLQVVNETALLRAASLSAIVRHCRIDVYRPLSRADNNIWITRTHQPPDQVLHTARSLPCFVRRDPRSFPRCFARNWNRGAPIIIDMIRDIGTRTWWDERDCFATIVASVLEDRRGGVLYELKWKFG